ncbi:uncharacterized protein LOC129609323 [Condylostylus longicornis]|uniref:uncharacterized protein LOC129609323 n=1 Tax=Condylostylus longicornis TaxID=2530218 RepID=UPI00244DA22A|nr:uncharacterized protein LOC129609323 [Condylostylus longicornis]
MVNLKWVPPIIGSLAPALIPPAHIVVLWYFWQNYSRYVDKRFCSCSCWDTVFKGPYESGIASYKHMYFNATQNTLKIWILSVFCIIVLYESVKKLTKLLLQRRARHSMIFLFTLSLYSHYYSWWSFVNYYNDDFFNQWNHQMVFTITELISTATVIYLVNKDTPLSPRAILCIVGISILHIAAGSVDQFIHNVILGEGYSHQVIRDVSLMTPDVMHLCIPVWLFRQTRKEAFTVRPFYRDRKLQREIAIMIFCVLILLTVLSFL